MNKGFLYIQKDKHKWLDDLLFHIQRSAHNGSFDTGLYTPLAYMQDFWDIRYYHRRAIVHTDLLYSTQ